MNKTDLIDHIAKQADISKAAAGRALDSLVGAIKTTLKKGGTVTIYYYSGEELDALLEKLT